MTPQHLLQFAILGSIYASEFLGIAKPRVAMLNIGEEKGKGNKLVREAYRAFRKSTRIPA